MSFLLVMAVATAQFFAGPVALCTAASDESCCCTADLPEPVSSCCSTEKKSGDAESQNACDCFLQIPDSPMDVHSTSVLPNRSADQFAAFVPDVKPLLSNPDTNANKPFLARQFLGPPGSTPPLFILDCSILR